MMRIIIIYTPIPNIDVRILGTNDVRKSKPQTTQGRDRQLIN